jgi:hypothetical protein
MSGTDSSRSASPVSDLDQDWTSQLRDMDLEDDARGNFFVSGERA